MSMNRPPPRNPYIPGDEPPRLGGERKLRVFRWGASYYFQFLRDWLLWR